MSLNSLMNTRSEPVASGLQVLFELIQAEGGQLIDGIMQLPPSVGTGYLQLLAPEAGLRLLIIHGSLRQELIIERSTDDPQPQTLLISFSAYDPPSDNPIRQLSSVQITANDIDLTTTLPAQTTLFIVAISIHKALLRQWLSPVEGSLPPVLTTHHPLVMETLQTPEIQRILTDLARPRSKPYLPSFFYKIRLQELIYWLFGELNERTAPVRFLHVDEVAKLYRVRTTLLASLSTPPSLQGLAQAVGLTESKLKQGFRQIFGTSPYAFYQFARFEEARRLLAYQSVSEVGYRLGFTNLSHFARLFEKYHQLTPKKYQVTLGR